MTPSTGTERPKYFVVYDEGSSWAAGAYHSEAAARYGADALIRQGREGVEVMAESRFRQWSGAAQDEAVAS